MKTQRVTTSQALIAFLKSQFIERDGTENPFFAGVWGIFGHGNLAGIGQALLEDRNFPYYLARNEQAMVHASAAYARMKNRLATFACTASCGPGSTNMITGAATATVNRIPVLLLPADIFARRNVAPVLQQLESDSTQDISVNDAFRPVSRYWDRINRADQLPFGLLEAMRVLTSPAQTGAVTLCLPQDVQTEAWDFPVELFERRVWHIARPLADRALLKRAVEWIRAAKMPLIISGGGVHYSGATGQLAKFAAQSGIGNSETQAGKGALNFDHPQQLGAIGTCGTPGANQIARAADLIIGVGTRYSDFTTSSKTQFENPNVRFINLNIAELDAFKHQALPLVSDARVTLEELTSALEGYRVPAEYTAQIDNHRAEWTHESNRLFDCTEGNPVSQSAIIGAVNRFSEPRDVVVCAAGSLPGDLVKLWNARDAKGYHVEYGFSCMGYEIAGGLGIKMADPTREVYVMVGDGSYQMMSSEIVTSLQEGYKLTIILIDNHGFGSIGALSKSLGCEGYGTNYRFRNRDSGQLDGALIPVDFAANAASYGAHTIKVRGREQMNAALKEAREQSITTVIVIEADKELGVPGYDSWWDVAVAEVSQMDSVREARAAYEKTRAKERFFL
jgi:3D-(3,5/4)-trihydroxycyclohexane-1,2-dione acylhydrolase (decyclizing)